MCLITETNNYLSEVKKSINYKLLELTGIAFEKYN